MNNLYDKIGLNYANLRQPDTRIFKKNEDALGSAETVLNVGAGAGSYESASRQITAIEPSLEMIQQRPTSNANVIQAAAEELPFADNSFDASMAILTIHHWSNQARGVKEMRRVTKDKIVFLTFDPSCKWFWLADYFPELAALDKDQMPQMECYNTWLGKTDVSVVPIPHDCTDGFLAAYWQRPSAYLDEKVRAAISSFWALGDISAGLKKLEMDLSSGKWEQRYSHLHGLDELDCGYRLVVAG